MSVTISRYEVRVKSIDTSGLKWVYCIQITESETK